MEPLIGIPIYILYFGLYQTIPIFICVCTSYTVVCGSGLFKALADRGKNNQGQGQGQGAAPNGSMSSNADIISHKDSEASIRESLMRQKVQEEQEFAASRYSKKKAGQI